MKQCLVTGASGFVGRIVCAGLAERGSLVRALMRHREEGPWRESVQCELGRDAPGTEILAGIDTVFHLAGKAHVPVGPTDDPLEYQRIHVQGTRDLLAAAADAGVQRFVFFSSVKVLDPPADDTPYSASKREAEQLVLQSAIPHVCVLRPALVYGPGHRGNLERMARAIDRGLFPSLASVDNRRSMVDVRDLAGAALLVAQHPKANRRCYVVGDGRPYSTPEIREALARALGRQSAGLRVPLKVLRYAARLGDLAGRVSGRRVALDSATLEKLVGSAWYDDSPLMKELGFVPSYRLQDAVDEMVAGFGLRDRRVDPDGRRGVDSNPTVPSE